MDLIEKCLNGKKTKLTITGGTVSKFIISPFLIWCDLFAPPEERDPENKFMHMLFERGIEHEKAVLKEMFSGVKKLELTSFEDAFRQAIEEMKKGTKILSSVPLFLLEENMYGIADIIQRDSSHASDFGDYHYVVKEIKSAKHLKDENIAQAALYNYILGKIQGYTPEKFWLINREKEEYEFLFADYEKILMDALKGIREIQKGKKVSPTAKAVRFPWESYAEKRAIEANDVSILPSVGAVVKEKLNDAGIFTVQEMVKSKAKLDLPDAMIEKLKINARAWSEKKAITIQKPKFKKADVELYLDFEGTDEFQSEEGMIKVDYLIGLLIKDGKSAEFNPFVSDSLKGEEKMFKDFAKFMKDYKDAPIYHYGHYEKTHIADLGRRYKVDVSHITKNMIDVLSIVKKSVALPAISLSLKEVAKFIGFKYRGMASGQDSIVLFYQFLESKDKKIMQRILDYNEDDVRATLEVKEFLEKLS